MFLSLHLGVQTFLKFPVDETQSFVSSSANKTKYLPCNRDFFVLGDSSAFLFNFLEI